MYSFLLYCLELFSAVETDNIIMNMTDFSFPNLKNINMMLLW